MKITDKYGVSSLNYSVSGAIQSLLTPSAYSSEKRSKLIANYLAELTEKLVDKKLLNVDDMRELLRTEFDVEE